MDNHEVQAGCFGRLLARKARPRGSNTARRVSRDGQLQDASNAEERQHCHDIDVAEKAGEIKYYSPCCDFSFGSNTEWWTEGEQPPSYTAVATSALADDNNIASIVEQVLDKENHRLRELSLKIHDHPETMFNEKYAHDTLTDFMEQSGFKITRHYSGLETAWRAEYAQGKGGRSAESELLLLSKPLSRLNQMYLLKLYFWGHQVIGTSPPRKYDPDVISPSAEEGGGGKVILLERGAYKEMDACIMCASSCTGASQALTLFRCHPSAGPPHSTGIGSSNSMQSIVVEYFGQSAHAGGAPWEGANALDAAFMAYSGISMLRQQMKPDERVHGVVEGKNWLPNVIPDYAKMSWLVRAPTSSDLVPLVRRVRNCLEAAALATGCQIKLTLGNAYFDLHQNPILAQGFADVVGSRYDMEVRTVSTAASTDFVTIPTVPNGGNHTPAFATAARSQAAHAATMTITKGLALTAYRVLTDDDFFRKVCLSQMLFQKPSKPV
ncbi:hypothetical protein CVT26_013177 [Gymnopilus dilepis]|uniref:Peptidase M20 dimerisation domain-containing protein n=1 Tax=Gymnopilus dilepis TaxID=231916 RepID=A0A409YFI3_9AGAR|nr:hypothetical protein CVT26_013177 [Gymnopilus dilepis]